MELSKDDIIKFYALKSHYNPTATNIAVLGTKEHFTKRMQIIKDIIPHDLLIQDSHGIKYTFLLDDRIQTYYNIKSLEDLDNLGIYFCKYM